MDHGSYTIIVTKEKSLTVTKNLSEVEEICCCRQLFRTHKTYLVNKKFISKIHQNKVQLRNYPDYALISRRKLKEISNVLNIRHVKAVS
jgi:DNA-binding LytR/AlgR family response regulator